MVRRNTDTRKTSRVNRWEAWAAKDVPLQRSADAMDRTGCHVCGDQFDNWGYWCDGRKYWVTDICQDCVANGRIPDDEAI